MSAPALIALVDCNNFFVSCERVFNPLWHDRPLVVLSNNDGCAVARSNEVKALGVKMGTPWFQMKDVARRYGIVGLSSNFVLYGDMSDRVTAVLREFSDEVEVYSIDESFVGLGSACAGAESPAATGQAMRRRVLQCTGLPVCVGIAPTKTLAKLANHIAKTQPHFDGVCDLSAMTESMLQLQLSQIEVGEIWGIGRRMADRLQRLGITTAGALRAAPLKRLRAGFGVVMERIVSELRGIPCLSLDEVEQPRQQLIASRSFGVPVRTVEELGEAISTHVSRASERLRRQELVCGAVHVNIATSRFADTERRYLNSITVGLPEATGDSRVLAGAALSGLTRIFREDCHYKKAGVVLLDLSPSSVCQHRLFNPAADDARSAQLMVALDAVNARYGRDTLRLGSAGLERRWQGRSENRTPRYTTNWDELPLARA
ncbi:MAG: polymerase subunit UmuC [Burkholderiaceae bacterium]|nr:polymerase subunit UmuC [Burkholderiaceae bacterium]